MRRKFAFDRNAVSVALRQSGQRPTWPTVRVRREPTTKLKKLSRSLSLSFIAIDCRPRPLAQSVSVANFPTLALTLAAHITTFIRLAHAQTDWPRARPRRVRDGRGCAETAARGPRPPH